MPDRVSKRQQTISRQLEELSLFIVCSSLTHICLRNPGMLKHGCQLAVMQYRPLIKTARSRGKMPAKSRFEFPWGGTKATSYASQKSSKRPSKFLKVLARGDMPGVVNDMYEFGEFRMDVQNRTLRRARTSSH